MEVYSFLVNPMIYLTSPPPFEIVRRYLCDYKTDSFLWQLILLTLRTDKLIGW
jgi:hypothetical protein